MDVRTKGNGDLMWNKEKWGVLEWLEFLLRLALPTAIIVIVIIDWLGG